MFFILVVEKNKFDISYLKNQLGLRCSDPLKSSPGSHFLWLCRHHK